MRRAVARFASIAALSALSGCTLSPFVPYDSGPRADDDAPLSRLDATSGNDAGFTDSRPADGARGDQGPEDAARLDADRFDAEPAIDARSLDGEIADAPPPNSDASPTDATAAGDSGPVDTGGASDATSNDAPANDAAASDAAASDAAPIDAGPSDAGFFPVTVAITGGGRTTSSQGAMSCTAASCAASYAPGTAITLSPVPNLNFGFSDWSGAAGCDGPYCSFVVNAATSLSAAFDSNLEAYYPLEDDGRDASGHGHQPSVESGVRSGGPGRVLRAVTFTAPAYNEILDAPGLDGGSALTICAWVHPDVSSASEQQVIRKDGVVQLAIGGTGVQRSARAQFTLANGGGTFTVTGNGVTEGQWTHLCARFCTPPALQDRDLVWLFINGGVAGAAHALLVVPPPVADSASSLFVGSCSGCSAAQSFGGGLDEVKVWDRCLSDAEVLSEASR